MRQSTGTHGIRFIGLLLLCSSSVVCTPPCADSEKPNPDSGTELPEDADGDGFSEEDGDCAPLNPKAYPGAPDPAFDGVDSDCDGADGTDSDGDGEPSFASGGGDCDDADPTVPRSEEWNGSDDDCDGCVDNASWLVALLPPSGESLGWLEVEVFGGDPSGYRFGVAQTGVEDGWLGESCADGLTNCHILASDEEYLDMVATTAEVVLSVSTYFQHDNIREASFVLIDSPGGCQAFGADAVAASTYYASLGCCEPFDW